MRPTQLQEEETQEETERQRDRNRPSFPSEGTSRENKSQNVRVHLPLSPRLSPPAGRPGTFLLLVHAQRVRKLRPFAFGGGGALIPPGGGGEGRAVSKVNFKIKKSALASSFKVLLDPEHFQPVWCFSSSRASGERIPEQEGGGSLIDGASERAEAVTARWDTPCGLCSRSNEPPLRWDTWRTH